MGLMINVVFSHCRSNVYLLIGVCVGLSISLFLTPMEMSESQALEDSLQYPLSGNNDIDEYEPRLNIQAKPQKAQKVPKVFVRPRYYSTELGIREKLFVGVLSSPEYLHSRAVALNKTVAHLVDKIRYFISIPEGTKPNVTLPGIVGFTDTRTILQPFHTLKYITDNYLEDYDYYFIVRDTTFVNSRKLLELVNQISVSRDIHLGVGNLEDTFCSLGGGILLSNSIVKRMKNNLDWCVKNTFSSYDDVNFGRCIVHATSIPCTNSFQHAQYHSKELNGTFMFERDSIKLTKDENFLEWVTVHPLYNHLDIYKFNSYLAEIELMKVKEQIESIRMEIQKTVNLTSNYPQEISWPIGNQPESKAVNRFDVLRWAYFNTTHVFLHDDFGTVKELDRDQKNDIDLIISSSIEEVNKAYSGEIKYDKLINGYWKFDSSRGIDYIIDLSFIRSGEKNIKRFHICKPLGKVEILPVPYVTENSRINMIIIVDSQKREEAMKFLAHYADVCMDKKDKIQLTVILLYNPGYTSRGNGDVYQQIKQRAMFLTEKYKKDQLKVTWLSIRLPISSSLIEIEPFLKIAIADLYVKKFSSDNLILFADCRMELKSEYLNRVRMNTISQWQVFSPIPFVQYDPDLIHYDPNTKNVEFDITHHHGKYDEHNFDSVSFYARDYLTVRKTIENQVPLVRNDKDIASMLKLSQMFPFGSIFEMFVVFSDLNPFRSVEPALKLQYREIKCVGTRNNVTLTSCLKQRYLHLGNRGQLTRLILDYKESY
ncbi:hypothetical protein QAD02_016138 [Eretmocerus hayati]|uniref:Uncharacterized protein n=1 Tax=Eretmocerus hayati TaxID=131215 RepID=A0ACC2PC26_9HYME|nr:hypothetical protein QAD02_016138 [Eretmocerus hayati]